MKAIPTGVYDYRELKQENYYSVDKTLMIKDFLERVHFFVVTVKCSLF